MARIVPLVEGPGDVEAVPVLLRKILHDRGEYQWQVARPHRVRSLKVLRTHLERFLRNAETDTDGGGILIVLDLEDECPKHEAHSLATETAKLGLTTPVAIVFAHREYEAWLLASLPTLGSHYGLPNNLVYEGEVEALRGPKEWLNAQMPLAEAYRETFHQVRFTHLLDLELAYERSRSFRRLYHAVEQLLNFPRQGGRGFVSPT